jgi:hypothetical protein
MGMTLNETKGAWQAGRRPSGPAWPRFALGLCLAALGVEASFQAVGVYPLELEGGGDHFFSLPLERPTVFQGRVATVSGQWLVMEAQPGWVENAWAGGGDEPLHAACVVSSGPLAGASFPILANSDRGLLVSLEGETVASLAEALPGERIRVVPYWTPRSLFAHTEVPVGTELFLYENGSKGLFQEPLEGMFFIPEVGWLWRDQRLAEDAPLERGTVVGLRLPWGIERLTVELVGSVPPTKDRRRWVPDVSVVREFLVGLGHPEALPLSQVVLEGATLAILLPWEPGLPAWTMPTEWYVYGLGAGWQVYPSRRSTLPTMEPGKAYRLWVFSTVFNRPSGVIWSHRPRYLE